MCAVGSISASTPLTTFRYLLAVPRSIPKNTPKAASVSAFLWSSDISRAWRPYGLDRVPESDARVSPSQKSRYRPRSATRWANLAQR